MTAPYRGMCVKSANTNLSYCCVNPISIFENIVLLFDHNYYVLSRRDSLIVNSQLLIVNYKHQFTHLLS